MTQTPGIVRFGPLRWPPRVATSIQYGLAGYALSNYYLHGIPVEVTAAEAAHGWVEFWGPQLGTALATLGFLWVIIDRFRQALRGPPA